MSPVKTPLGQHAVEVGVGEVVADTELEEEEVPVGQRS